MHHRFVSVLRLGLLAVMIGGLLFPSQSPVYAASTLSIEPNSWNIIGLDSNTPATGPFRFPIGAKVCNNDTVLKTNVDVAFYFDNGSSSTDPYAGDTYINLRSGSLQTITIPSIAAGDCEDAFFEVEVNKVAAAFDKTREYHIVADDGGTDEISTAQPRELYVEHLISQNRNSVTDVELDDVSIAAGGTMTLMVGNTYKIDLEGGTATQGYNQFEDFINFPNTIFQVLSVETDYSANSKPLTPDPNYPYLYADACGWDNDPNSPTYRSCIVSDDKAGGSQVVTTYIIKIIGGAGTTQTLNTLLYDFSGSSYHYNADFSVGTRYAYIVGPSSVTMTKSFSPKAIAPSGSSVMTIKLVNPTTQTISGANFVDTFPLGLTVAGTPGTAYSGCGAGTFSAAPVGTDPSVSFVNGTIAPNSICTITLNVTAAFAGTYANTTNNLFIDVNGTNTDTGNNATDTLTVASAASCTPGQTLVSWTVPVGSANPPDTATGGAGSPTTNNTGFTATASANVPARTSIDNSGQNDTRSWQTYGYQTAGQYVQFVVDTRYYSGVTMNFYLKNASIANGPTTAAVSYNNGTGFTALPAGTLTIPATTAWTLETISFSGLTSTTGTTTFRIAATGAANDNSGAGLSYDAITFTGCALPTPSPTFNKAFKDSTGTSDVTTIQKGTTSVLRFTLNNTAPGNKNLSGITFDDTLPAGLSITNSTSSQCGGTLTTTAATRTITFTGGSLVAGGSCTLDVNVTGTTEGDYENVTGYLSSTQTGTTTSYATDTLKVVAPPVLSKAFSPTSIFTTENSTLSFTIKNPNLSTSLSGIGFTDTLPAGVTATNGTTNSLCTTGSLVITGGNLLTFTGGSLAENISCTFDVPVTGSASGTKNNTTSAVTSAEGGNGNTAAATLIVQDRSPSISLTKQISTIGNTGPWSNFVRVDTNSSIWYRFIVYNSGDVSLTQISVTDSNVDVSSCISTSLSPGETYYCVVGPISTNPTAGEYPNTAQAHGTYVGVVSSPNSTATYANPELTIIKNVAESYFATAGNILHYSFSVENTGFAPLLGPVTVTDDKIGSVSCQDVSAVGDFDNYLDQNEIVNCPASGTVDYTVLASPDVSPNKQVTNKAYASASSVDSSTVSKTVLLASDLTILKSHSPSGVIVPGNNFNWTLEVSNSSTAGPATFAVGQTILSDSLPTGATYDPIIIMGGTLFLGPGTIDCTIGSGILTCIASGDSVTLPSGASFSATIVVTPTATGTLVNPANGGTCQVDPGAGVIAEINDANNDCNPDTVIVDKASPTITTNASPITGTVGTQVLKAGDTATLISGYNPTGSVIFTLYSDNTCTTPVPAMSGSGTISAGSASWSANWTPTAAGTYYWTAGYAGDSNNNSYTTGCTDANEQIVIARASPTLSTTPNPSSATNGDTLNDTAALSGGYNPTGSVTFNLYSPTDTTCSGIPAYAETDASSPYATTTGFASNAVGTWRWTATYSGDTNNDAATSGCNAELVAVAAVNLLPVATANSYTIAEGATASGNVMTDGVTDTLGDPPTTVTSYDASSVNGGTVAVAADGSFTYDPNGYVGTDTFTYTITDVNGDTSTATVTVNVYTPPTVTKSFTPSTILVGGTSTMTIVVTNPASNPGNLTGVSIDDIYTGTLVNNAAGDVGCSGAGNATLTGGTNGDTSVGFIAGTIVPGGTCTITQSVTATSTNINTTGNPTATGPVSLTGTTANATLTVLSLPVATITVAPASVAEDGVTNLVYTVTLDKAPFVDTTMNLTTTGTAAGSDYSGAVTSVTILAGNTTGTVTINPTTDTTVEGDETIIITIDPGTGYIVGTPSSATGTITDDDIPVATIAVSPASVLEDGATNLVYTVTLDKAPLVNTTINLATTGTATSGGDYTGAVVSVTILAGNTAGTVTIDPTVDTTVEPDETVIITIDPGTGYIVGIPSSATGTITDDDLRVATISVTPASVAEDGVTDLVYTVTLDMAPLVDTTINLTTAGTATSGGDYTGAVVSVTILAGNTTGTVTINPTTDTIVEPDETVIITIDPGTGYTVGTPSSATGTITDDDLPVATIAVAPASVLEDSVTNLVYTVTLDKAPLVDTTINLATTGTAAGSDYTGSVATVTILAGNTTGTITINPTTDTLVEPDETVIITIDPGTGYTAGTPSSATGTITNDDIAATFVISGHVRYDVDKDGDLADADSGLAGADVALFTDPNGDGDPSDGVQIGVTIATDGTGTYSFGNLTPGNYVVVETNPAGYISTADSSAPNDDLIPVVIANTDSAGNVFLDTINLPDAVDDTDTTNEGTPVTTSVLTNDDLGTTPTTITANTQGTNGTVNCTATQCTYTPDAGFSGTDTYTYTITDNNGNTDTATVTITVNKSLIGISKRLVSKTEVTAGIWDVTYELYVRNYGTTVLNSLQVTDNLTLAFPSPSTYTVKSVSTADFTKNAGFNGNSDISLLAGTDSLAIGADGTITLVVSVVPANAGPFENTAIAGGQCPTCLTPVTDISQNGTDPDPDTDKDPTNNSVKTPIDFGPNLFDPPFGLKILDASGLPVLQWTMVWINNSNIVAVNAQVSDPIVTSTTFIGGSLTCTPSGVTTTTSCTYDSAANRIIWSGNLGPDLGATDAASAANEITITFRVNVAAGIRSVQNIATVDSDLNGNQLITDPGEQQVASASARWTAPVSTAAASVTLPKTGFAPNVITDLQNVPHETYVETNGITVEIPSLGINIPIVGVPKKDGTWNVAWLGNQAGWLEGSAFPSWSGNSVLTGHVYLANGLPGPFVNLNKLKYGDQIVVHAYGQKYIFEVQTNEVVQPNDKSVMQHEEKSWITLVTCKDYDEKTNTYKKRVVVRAVLVKVTTD